MENREVYQENDSLTTIFPLSPSIGAVAEPSFGNPTFFLSPNFVEGFFNSGSVFSPSRVTHTNFLLHLDPDVSILDQTITKMRDFLNVGSSEPPPPQTTIATREAIDVEGFLNSVVEAAGIDAEGFGIDIEGFGIDA